MLPPLANVDSITQSNHHPCTSVHRWMRGITQLVKHSSHRPKHNKQYFFNCQHDPPRSRSEFWLICYCSKSQWGGKTYWLTFLGRLWSHIIAHFSVLKLRTRNCAPHVFTFILMWALVTILKSFNQTVTLDVPVDMIYSY